MSDMQIAVVSRGNVWRIHTLHMLEAAGIDYSVFVHDDEAFDSLANAGIAVEKIVVTGTFTLVEKRNWILDEWVKPGNWFIGMDDNIQHFTMVAPGFIEKDRLDVTGPSPKGFKTWRSAYNIAVSPPVWLKEFTTTVHDARNIGAPLVGVATMENPFFRPKRFSRVRFVKTKVFAMQNLPHLRFKHEMCHDSYLSAAVVAHHGRVLVDSFLHYKSKMYEQGGLGDRADRERKGLLEQMDDICREFPGLVQVGKGANTALRFKVNSEKGVERWRSDWK